MARRRHRFSNLEKQFREAGGEASPGSRLAGYIDYKKGINKVNIENRPPSELLERIGVAIIPFNYSPGATLNDARRIIVPITLFSDNGRRLLGLSDNELGYSGLTGASEDENFYPALLKVFVTAASATVKNPISGITKKPYKRRLGQSYTMPFGRTLTTAPAVDPATGIANTTIDDVDEEDVRVALTYMVKAATIPNVVVRSVSYEPELVRVGRQQLGERPATVPGNPTLPTT